ncbi:hypothetical protein Tco_0443431, partial [Tanacetum coccineum]
SSKEKGIAEDQDSERSTPSPPITGSPRSIYQPRWSVPNSCRLDTLEACQDVASGYGLLAEVEIQEGGEAFEEICSPASIRATSSNDRGKRIMAAFEEFKKHEDERVCARCAEMDARLDALRVDFDKELYPHMLTVIAGRRWVIGHGLRLAVMKCAESTELRQAFANVVSTKIAKGMSEGLKYGVEHGKAGLELTTVEAYDPEADNKYVAALYNLKDLSYPLIDELEQLKDAPLDVIMASLYLKSDTEVRNPRNPWACKDEILLGDAIAANVSGAEKKKKSRVVCRTHGVGSAHHARSDGIPVSVPTVAPQGLQILLADAATQTEDKESPRLLRSKSLLALFTLDLP